MNVTELISAVLGEPDRWDAAAGKADVPPWCQPYKLGRYHTTVHGWALVAHAITTTYGGYPYREPADEAAARRAIAYGNVVLGREVGPLEVKEGDEGKALVAFHVGVPLLACRIVLRAVSHRARLTTWLHQVADLVDQIERSRWRDGRPHPPNTSEIHAALALDRAAREVGAYDQIPLLRSVVTFGRTQSAEHPAAMLRLIRETTQRWSAEEASLVEAVSSILRIPAGA